MWDEDPPTPEPLRLVVCDLSTSPAVDLAGARCCRAARRAEGEGRTLRLVAAHAALRDLLRAEGLEEQVGYFGRRISVADVVDEFEGAGGATTASGDERQS